MSGKGLQLIEIYIGIGGLEIGSGVTRSPGLVFKYLRNVKLGTGESLIQKIKINLWNIR